MGVSPRSGFDTLLQSIVSVFQILGGSGWPTVMQQAIEATDMSCILYFYSLIFVGSFLLFNLFVAVIIVAFNRQKELVPVNMCWCYCLCVSLCSISCMQHLMLSHPKSIQTHALSHTHHIRTHAYIAGRIECSQSHAVAGHPSSRRQADKKGALRPCLWLVPSLPSDIYSRQFHGSFSLTSRCLSPRQPRGRRREQHWHKTRCAYQVQCQKEGNSRHSGKQAVWQSRAAEDSCHSSGKGTLEKQTRHHA